MHSAEETHWWYKGMAAITRVIIEKYYSREGSCQILDAGCGTGAGMAFLSLYGTVTGLDLSPYALSLCRRRGMTTIARGSVMSIPFSDESFDLVTAFDVLYFAHIDDDAALREFHRVLAPGGRVILRVPAYNWLRGIHDIKVSTGHRYTLTELRVKIESNGFRSELMSYANTLLLPFIALKRISEKWWPPQQDSDISIRMGALQGLFEYFLISESRIIKRRPLPFGLSLFAVARKTTGPWERGKWKN